MAQNSKLRPANNKRNDYSVYDSEEFRTSFVTKSAPMASQREANLLIEGITCYACIWLIRQAIDKKFSSASQIPPSISINQATGAAIMCWDDSSLKLSDLVEFTESLGYHVMPHRGESLRDDHAALIRVGVGLFVMVNVMSFALAEYFAGSEGIDPSLEVFLRWISLSMTAVSLAWPGREFFTNTLRSIKARSPSIDAPILVGLLAATIWSIWNTISARGTVYFDSVCAIIALVITGRYIQQAVLRRNQSRMAALLNPKDGWVLVQRKSANDHRENDWIPVRARDVKKGETLRVLPGDMVALRVLCKTSCAEISFEQLRGEPHWTTVNFGEEIPAGSINGNAPIEVVASQNGAESYTESLSRSIEKAINEKGHYQRWSDKAAWTLFIGVFFAAAAVFAIVGRNSPEEGLSRAVALLLVACPCTFAIGVPLVFGTAMTRALRDGILFKSQRSLEKLSSVHHFIFDKTGTLTEGAIRISKWIWAPHIDEATQTVILRHLGGIDKFSSHHTAQAIAAEARETAPVTNVAPNSIKETHGMGMSITYEHHQLSIGKQDYMKSIGIPQCSQFPISASVIVSWDGQPAAAIEMDDKTRAESASLIRRLRSLHCRVEILSGDSKHRTQKIAKELAVETADAHSQATPGSKLLFVKSKSASESIAMVGNGLNDAGAMSEAQVSIAVANASTTAISSADICLLDGDISLVADAVIYSRKTRQRTLTVFAIALVYNLLGLTLAALGLVTPVVAAILMPISSLTITKVATSWPGDKNNAAKTGGP